jgi:glycogen(starch) synthase
MMKILMTSGTAGGVWTYSMELCAALRPYGVSIALATMGKPLSAQQRQQVARLPQVQLFESHYRLCWMENPWEDVAAAGRWLMALEREFQPDIVHLNDLAHGGLDWQAPVLLVAHSCVLSWWHSVRKQPAPAAQWQRYREVVANSIRRASAVCAPTSAMLANLRCHYGPLQNASVIVNGRSFPGLLPAPELKVPVMEPLILCAGRLWDEAKNIAALGRVADQVPWRICVAGDGDPGNPRLHRLGFLSEDRLAHWLARASIYAAPAYYEPFGLAILEAARAGCALVLGNIPSLREVWGDAAEYVDPDDPDDLQRTLNGLIDRPQRLREMMERAWRRAQRYSDTRMAAGYMHCYRRLQDAPIPPHYSNPPRLHSPLTSGVPL